MTAVNRRFKMDKNERSTNAAVIQWVFPLHEHGENTDSK
jgi:hypothetical protein